jgi:hypothetical protein
MFDFILRQRPTNVVYVVSTALKKTTQVEINDIRRTNPLWDKKSSDEMYCSTPDFSISPGFAHLCNTLPMSDWLPSPCLRGGVPLLVKVLQGLLRPLEAGPAHHHHYSPHSVDKYPEVIMIIISKY